LNSLLETARVAKVIARINPSFFGFSEAGMPVHKAHSSSLDQTLLRASVLDQSP
jgi:hypothetical protein